MALAIFDSHAFVKGAVAAGMTDQQAEFLASSYQSLLTDRIATKDDIAHLGERINRLEERMDRLEARMDRLEATLWRVAGFLVAVMISLFGAFAALLRYII